MRASTAAENLRLGGTGGARGTRTPGTVRPFEHVRQPLTKIPLAPCGPRIRYKHRNEWTAAVQVKGLALTNRSRLCQLPQALPRYRSAVRIQGRMYVTC